MNEQNTFDETKGGEYDPKDLLAEKMLDHLWSGNHKGMAEQLGATLMKAGTEALGRPPDADEEDDRYWKARTETMEDLLKRMIAINRKGLPSKKHPSDVVISITPELV